MKETESYLYGKNPVFEALKKPGKVEKVYIQYNTKKELLEHILFLARNAGCQVTRLDKKKFHQLEQKVCPQNVNSQGVIALLPMVKHLSLNDLINDIDISENPILIALDGISDPQNLGAIARSAECAGVKAMIMPERETSPVTAVAYKASAGAFEYLKTAKVNNLNNALEALKDAGYWIIGTDMKGETPYYADVYDRPVVIVIGSEGKGIRPSTINHCDYVVSISMAGQTESLNASVSAGIVLFEALRQKIDKL